MEHDPGVAIACAEQGFTAVGGIGRDELKPEQYRMHEP